MQRQQGKSSIAMSKGDDLDRNIRDVSRDVQRQRGKSSMATSKGNEERVVWRRAKAAILIGI